MLVVISLVAMSFGLHAQTDPPAALVAKAAAYVEGYQAKFSAVVCEEQQTQKVISANRHQRTDDDCWRAGDRSRTENGCA